MSLIPEVLGLFETGQAAQAVALVNGATVTPEIVSELYEAADHLEEERLAARLRNLSDQLQEGFQARPEETDVRQLQTNLAALFRDMDSEARRRLASRLKRTENNAMIRQTLAEMMREGRWREMGTFLSQQTDNALQEPIFLRARFGLSLEQGDLQAAREFADAMIESAPQDPEGYLCRAEWALAGGDWVEVRKMSDRAQALAEPHFDTRLSLREKFFSLWVRMNLAENHFLEAERDLQQWFDEGSKETLAERHYLRGLIEVKKREGKSVAAFPSRVFEDLQEACRLSPQRADYPIALAKAGILASAVLLPAGELHKVRKLDPVNPNIWREMAYLELRLNFWKSAADDFEKAARLLNRRVEALIPAGLGLIVAYAQDDLECATALEMFLRDVAGDYDPSFQKRPLILPLAIQNFHAVWNQWASARKPNISEKIIFKDTLTNFPAFFQQSIGQFRVREFQGLCHRQQCRTEQKRKDPGGFPRSDTLQFFFAPIQEKSKSRSPRHHPLSLFHSLFVAADKRSAKAKPVTYGRVTLRIDQTPAHYISLRGQFKFLQPQTNGTDFGPKIGVYRLPTHSRRQRGFGPLVILLEQTQPGQRYKITAARG